MDDKKHILIVEDEILIAQLLKSNICKHGYDCAGIAINFNAARQLLETTKIDLVLLDIKLSGKKSGIDVAKMVKDEFGIPFLFLTSYNDVKTLDEIKNLDAKGYINKPINEATLLTMIDIVFNNQQKTVPTYISVTVGTTTYNLNISELLYIVSEHVYVKVYCKNKTHLIRYTLTSFLDLLPQKTVIQINRSVAVNPLFIDSISSSKIYMCNQEFTISKKYKVAFQKEILNKE